MSRKHLKVLKRKLLEQGEALDIKADLASSSLGSPRFTRGIFGLIGPDQ